MPSANRLHLQTVSPCCPVLELLQNESDKVMIHLWLAPVTFHFHLEVTMLLSPGKKKNPSMFKERGSQSGTTVGRTSKQPTGQISNQADINVPIPLLGVLMTTN